MKRFSKNTRDFLFTTLLTIGVVIGVGVFFKNKSIIAATHGDSKLIIIGWVLGGAISLASAVAFSLLSFKTKNSDNNTAEFMREAYGEKTGNLVKWGNVLIYFPIYIFVISLFSNIQLFDLFNIDHNLTYYPILLFSSTTMMVIIFIFINFFDEKISKVIHISATSLKMIPFFVLSIIALAAIFQTNEHAFWNNGQIIDVKSLNTSSYNQTSSMAGIAIVFWIIPAVKFSFDGFVSVTSNRRSASVKSLSWGISIGVLIVTIFFILATIATLKQGVSSIPEAIVSFFGGEIKNMKTPYVYLYKIITLIIVISGLGSMNGFIFLWKKMALQIIDDNNLITEKQKTKKSTFLIMITGIIFSCLPWIILTLIILLNNVGKVSSEGADVLDEVSNIVLLLHFTTNAFVLARFLWLKFKKKIELSWFFAIASIIAILGIGITVLWKIIDHLIIQIILYGTERGMFDWPKWCYVLFFIAVISQVFIAPMVGRLIMKGTKYGEIKDKNCYY